MASLAVLGAGCTLLINGYPIAECPVPCAPDWPLSDLAHVASIAPGLAAAAAAALVAGNIVALANAAPTV